MSSRVSSRARTAFAFRSRAALSSPAWSHHLAWADGASAPSSGSAELGGWVELDGQRFDIRAQVHTISGYSAHADQKDLVNFVRRMKKKPTQIRIVHGDDDAKAELQRKFRVLVPEAEVIIPDG